MVMTVPRTNRRSAFDIELDGIGFKLIDAIDVRQDPGTEPSPDAVYNDFSRGMGYSEEYVPGTYSWGENVCTRFGPVLPGGKVTKVDVGGMAQDLYPFRSSVEYQGDLLFFGGRYVVRIPGGTGGAILAKDLGTNVACGNQAAEVFNGTLYVGTVIANSDVTYRMWAYNGVWTEYPLILRRAFKSVYWDSGGVGAQRLVGMPNRTSFQSVAGDPTVGANWSAAVNLGNTSHPVNSIAGTARTVFFVSTGGVLKVDSRGYVGNLTPYFQQAHSGANGVAAEIHEGDLYTTWNRGMVRVGLTGAREDTPEFCQPGADQPNGTPIFGFTNAMAVDQGWLVSGIYNPATEKSYICYGKDKRILGIDAIGPLIHHGAEVVLDGLVTHMRVSAPAGAQPRLWIWTQPGGQAACLYWVSLPSYGTPLQDLLHGGGHTFANSGSLYVRDGWDRPNTRRVPVRYRVHADRLNGAAKISVYRRNDSEIDASGDPVYTRRVVANSSPYTTALDTSLVSAAQVDFRIDLSGGDTNPPVFRSLGVEADVNREQTPLRSYTVEIERPQITARGTGQRRSIRSVLYRLRRISGIDGTPVDFTDEDGQVSKVQMLPGLVEHKVRTRNGRWKVQASFLLRHLWNGARHWGDGTRYGEGEYWGAS